MNYEQWCEGSEADRALFTDGKISLDELRVRYRTRLALSRKEAVARFKAQPGGLGKEAAARLEEAFRKPVVSEEHV